MRNQSDFAGKQLHVTPAYLFVVCSKWWRREGGQKMSGKSHAILFRKKVRLSLQLDFGCPVRTPARPR